MWLFTHAKHTAVWSFLHLLAIPFTAALNSLVLPWPFLPAFTNAAIAACESLNINNLFPVQSSSVLAIAVTSAFQTVALSPRPLPPRI